MARTRSKASQTGCTAQDLQGWNSDHAYLREVVDVLRPRLIVEVGVWKGCSVITMAQRLKALGVDGVVLAVDTWLGAWDHWLVGDYFEELGFHNGYPTLFWHFMANVVGTGVQDHVVPLPLDSLNAYEVLARKGMRIDAVHIDAGHDYTAVRKDLEAWWALVRPGGVLISDDYFDDENKAWPEVKQAVDDFARNQGLAFRHEAWKGVARQAVDLNRPPRSPSHRQRKKKAGASLLRPSLCQQADPRGTSPGVGLRSPCRPCRRRPASKARRSPSWALRPRPLRS